MTMEQYVGVNILCAEPMTRSKYNSFRGWELPEDEDGNDEGYLVKREDGHVSWFPKETFDKYHRLITDLPYSFALEAVKKGCKAARKVWNGNDMFIFLVEGSTFTVNRKPLLGIYPTGTSINYRSHIDMKTVDGSIVPWVASQTDQLADDWYIKED